MINVSFTFQLPEEVKTDPNIEALRKIEQNDTAKEVVAASLYSSGLLTQKQARLLINKNRREFQEILEKHGFPASGHIDEEDFKKLVESHKKL